MVLWALVLWALAGACAPTHTHTHTHTRARALRHPCMGEGSACAVGACCLLVANQIRGVVRRRIVWVVASAVPCFLYCARPACHVLEQEWASNKRQAQCAVRSAQSHAQSHYCALLDKTRGKRKKGRGKTKKRKK